MIFIYNCYGGTHSSSLASAVHLKKLPTDRIPTKDEILGAEYFNKLKYKDMGRIIYHGVDDEGNKVYSVGRGTSKILIPCLKNLITVLHDECGFNDKIVFSNMSPTVPPIMTLGGFLARGLGMDFIGVPFLVMGAKQTYKKVVEIVNHTRQSAKTLNEPVLVLMNDSKN